MELSALSNLQIFIIIVFILSLIIFLLVSNRSKNIPTDAEAFNNALKALVNGEKDKAYHLLREIISKDSNNIDAFLLLGDLVREKDVNQAIKIHQTVILRPHISQSKKIEAHTALSKDFIKNGNISRAEEELNNILSMDSSNKWALLKLKDRILLRSAFEIIALIPIIDNNNPIIWKIFVLSTFIKDEIIIVIAGIAASTNTAFITWV